MHVVLAAGRRGGRTRLGVSGQGLGGGRRKGPLRASSHHRLASGQRLDRAPSSCPAEQIPYLLWHSPFSAHLHNKDGSKQSYGRHAQHNTAQLSWLANVHSSLQQLWGPGLTHQLQLSSQSLHAACTGIRGHALWACGMLPGPAHANQQSGCAIQSQAGWLSCCHCLPLPALRPPHHTRRRTGGSTLPSCHLPPCMQGCSRDEGASAQCAAATPSHLPARPCKLLGLCAH
jgi:hypothetical protein